MGLYNSRSDLQAAFPNAYANSTTYGQLLWWAGEVVNGAFGDPARTALSPWGYAYDLLGLYVTRADLQAAYPNALESLPSDSTLTNWAGGVVNDSYFDTDLSALQPYAYWYELMMIYNGRSDLQTAYPNAFSNESRFVSLVDWAGGATNGTFVDDWQSWLLPFGGYYVLMWVYGSRADLQSAFPNAFTNGPDYHALLVWADEVVTGKITDPAYTTLVPYAIWYEEYG